MITGFLKKHRAAIIITGSYILLMLLLYLLKRIYLLTGYMRQ